MTLNLMEYLTQCDMNNPLITVHVINIKIIIVIVVYRISDNCLVTIYNNYTPWGQKGAVGHNGLTHCAQVGAGGRVV